MSGLAEEECILDDVHPQKVFLEVPQKNMAGAY